MGMNNEYRIDMKIRNNIILYKIEQAGYKNIGEFCRLNGISNHNRNLYQIINMTKSPLKINGEFQTCVIKTAELLGCSPENFFTDIQLNSVIKTNKRSIQVNEAEMKFMLESSENKQKLLESIVEDDQRDKTIEEVLCTLTPREQKVIEMRMGLGNYNCEHTLAEVGLEVGISPERTRQVEQKAFRKLRHPERANQLREFIQYTE
jgi:RNA polymerase sigma factor (sigma-70 family)